jgi:hypothetical protein
MKRSEKPISWIIEPLKEHLLGNNAQESRCQSCRIHVFVKREEKKIDI